MVSKLAVVGVGAGVAVVGALVARKLLSKAGSHPAAASAGAGASAVDLGFAKTAADAVAMQKSLQPAAAGDDGKADRMRYFFLYRRAVALGLADATLRAGPGLTQLQQRIGAQFDLVAQFLAPLIGTAQQRGPYFGGTPNPLPTIPLLDLGGSVHVRDIDPTPTTEADAVAATLPNQQQAQTLRELDARRIRVIAIVWRAAAIEAEVWSGTGDGVTLVAVELSKLLDRRLRSVERLRYQVAARATEDRDFTGVPDSATLTQKGPWHDGFGIHAFERPSMPRTARSDDGSWVVEAFIPGVTKLTQWLTVDGHPTGGTFTLEFDGDLSPDIPFDATDAQLLSAIQAIPSVGTLNVQCSPGSLASQLGLQIDMASIGAPIGAGLQLTVASSALLGDPTAVPNMQPPFAVTDAETTAVPRFSIVNKIAHWYLNHGTDDYDWNLWPGTRIVGKQWQLAPMSNFLAGYGWTLVPPGGVQTLSIADATGGTFTLTFADKSTPAFPNSVSASALQAALRALPGVAPKVVVFDDGLGSSPTFSFYFDASVPATAVLAIGTNSLVGNLPELKVGTRTAASGKPPSQVIDELFAQLISPTFSPPDANGQTQITDPGLTRADWWDRSWLHSDGMLAALHLEALRFALMRAPVPSGTRPDDEFDALPWKFSLVLDDCFQMRQVAHPADSIMAPGKTDYFLNDAVPLDDLQIGDQVMFDSSPPLIALGTTAWDYPTVLVTNIDTSADAPTVNLTGTRVQNLGTDELAVPDFQLLRVTTANAILKRLQAYIPAEIIRLRAAATAAGDPFTTPTMLPWDIGIVSASQYINSDPTVLRQWSPYAGDTWDDPGPWWIFINIHATIWQNAIGTDAMNVLAKAPGAVILASPDKLTFQNRSNPWRATGASPVISVGPGFQAPPTHDAKDPGGDATDGILVPLFQPFGGWEAYFDAKFSTPNNSAWPSKLDPVTTDARWFPGLAAPPPPPAPAPPSNNVRVIKPRAKSTP